MGKKILILGNGFDLDLGLKSRYKDFMSSETWKISSRIQYKGIQNLLWYLGEKNEINTWFDAETELLNYALNVTNHIIAPHPDMDRDGHVFFQTILKKYLIQEQDEFTFNRSSVAAQLMKIVVENGFFDEIYTFNYTDINKILSKAGLHVSIKTTFLHGSLRDDDNIILGIETDQTIHEDYHFLFKTNSRFYRYNSLLESMEKADEIIFFGHSINGMDFPYFKDFFMKQSRTRNGLKRKYITIFTYDNNSDEQIRNNFREAGVNLRDLMQRNNLTFIETKLLKLQDTSEQRKWNEQLEHLNEDSMDAKNRKIKRIESMFL